MKFASIGRKLKRSFIELFDIATKEDLSMNAIDIGVGVVAGNNIPGDYFKFGVYRGKSFIRAYDHFAMRARFQT